MSDYSAEIDEILLKFTSSEINELGVQQGAINNNPQPYSLDEAKAALQSLIAKAEVAGRIYAQDSHIGRLEVLRAWAENHKPVFQEGERAMAFTIFEIDNEIRIVKKWQDELKAQGDDRG